jgi:hypothetical protein
MIVAVTQLKYNIESSFIFFNRLVNSLLWLYKTIKAAKFAAFIIKYRGAESNCRP